MMTFNEAQRLEAVAQKKKQGGDVMGTLTLRDYFAAKWMQAYVANPATADITDAELAQYSYEIADAMLEARKQK